METLLAEVQLAEMLSTIIYSLIGVVVFFIAYLVFDKMTPFSVHKEIEQDQNVALGIIVGSGIIGLAIIIAAAIQG